MFQALHCRAGHYLLLTAAWAVLALVNLGAPSLWDIDEGNNAEAAREMYVSGNYIVPTFNYELRVDKPALLYWLQAAAYHTLGINEFSARLPSALAALLTVLLTYELGRRMFGPGTGLLAGLVLASCPLFCVAARFANPDALLNLCILLTLFFFWRDYERGGAGWLVIGGATTGLGMLAKGPVGLVLPSAVTLLFLFRQGQLRRVLHPYWGWAVLTFSLVAVPWYAWVGADTKGEFLRGFFLRHNVGRFLDPMENHRGPVVYYLLVLIAGVAPWSVFYLLTGWHAWKQSRDDAKPQAAKYRFLACWIAVFVVFFTVSRTKLPNYVLPVYPAVAILIAHFLARWRRGEITPPAWAVHLTLASLLLTGALTAAGLLVGGGAVGGGRGGVTPPLLRGRHLPGLEVWALLGIIPALAGLAGWWCRARGRRGGLIAAVAVAAVLFTGLLTGWGAAAVDRHKAPRPLVAALEEAKPGGEVLIGTYRYFQPSLVFYCGHEITKWPTEFHALDSLRYPITVYLFVPAKVWEAMRPKLDWPYRELGRHRDLYRGCDVVLVTNR